MALPHDLFVRVSSGQTCDRVLSVYYRNFEILLGLSVSTYLPFIVVVGALTFTEVLVASEITSEFSLLTTGFFLVCLFPISLLVTIAIAKGAIIQAVADFYAGNSPSYWRSLRVSIKRGCTVFCCKLLTFVIGIAPVVLLFKLYSVLPIQDDDISVDVFILFLIVSFLWLVLFYISVVAAIPIIIIENRSVLDGIKDSYRLSVGFRKYIFCTLLWLLIPATYLFRRRSLCSLAFKFL